MIRIFLELMIVLNAHAQQRDLLKCDNGHQQLRVYQVVVWNLDDVFFEIRSGSDYQGYYLRGGPIKQSYENGMPMQAYKNDFVRIVRLFGEYHYMSEEFNASFFDSDCANSKALPPKASPTPSPTPEQQCDAHCQIGGQW